MSTRRERAKAQMRQQAMEIKPIVLASNDKNRFLFELGKYCYDFQN